MNVEAQKEKLFRVLDEIESEVLEQYESYDDINPLTIKGISHLCF